MSAVLDWPRLNNAYADSYIAGGWASTPCSRPLDPVIGFSSSHFWDSQRLFAKIRPSFLLTQPVLRKIITHSKLRARVFQEQ